MNNINDIKRRVISGYPDWYSWSPIQRQLLMLRATHGSYRMKGMFNPLKELSKVFGIDVLTLDTAITDTPSLKKALADYDTDNAYRHGVSKSGKKMQRATRQDELMQLIAYDSIPTVITAISNGTRPRLAKTEAPFLDKYLEDISHKQTRRKRSYSVEDDGLPNWGNWEQEEQLKPFERDINPEDPTTHPDYSADGLPEF